MTVIELPGAAVLLAPIPEGPESRRERERLAAADALEKLVGRRVEILHTPEGAPYPADRSFHLSISHSRHVVAVLAGSEPGWGVDIEEERPGQLERVASRVLNEGESSVCQGLLQAWTLKEAAFKAAGLPIADLREIHLHPDGLITARGLRLATVLSQPVPDHRAWLSVVKLGD